MTAPEQTPVDYSQVGVGTLETNTYSYLATPYDHDMYDPKCSVYDAYSDFHTQWEVPCSHQHFCYHCAKNGLGGYA